MLTTSSMDICHRTRSSRPSRRGDLFLGQWEQRRYEQHRQRVKRDVVIDTFAKPRIDVAEPVSTSYQHIQIKQKKIQRENERRIEVMMSNLILLRHLAEISMSKRIDDGIEKKIHWKDYYNTILIMRKQQVERLRAQLETAGSSHSSCTSDRSRSASAHSTLRNRRDTTVSSVSDLGHKDPGTLTDDELAGASAAPKSNSSGARQQSKKKKRVVIEA